MTAYTSREHRLLEIAARFAERYSHERDYSVINSDPPDALWEAMGNFMGFIALLGIDPRAAIHTLTSMFPDDPTWLEWRAEILRRAER